MTSNIKVEELHISALASDNYPTRLVKAGDLFIRIQEFLLNAEEGCSVFVTMVKPVPVNMEGGAA